MESYLTVREGRIFSFTEKKSEFIGECAHTSSEDEAIAFINGVRKKHSAAKHNVYAYVLREGNTARFSDDGEPHGTAGMPVLDIIRKNCLTDVSIAVTRYFGGILLGTGGLLRAYSAAAAGAVSASVIGEMRVFAVAELLVSYADYRKLPSVVSDCGGSISDSDFGDRVKVTLRLPDERFACFCESAANATSGRAKPIFLRKICDFSDKR